MCRNEINGWSEKLFVAHVGTVNYVSKNKEYSHKERFFDRFIEVTKSTDISAGETPDILDACPTDCGFNFSNFCLPSRLIPLILL